MNAGSASPVIDSVTNAVPAAASVASSQDPLILSITFVAAVVIGLVAIAKPLMGLYREYKKTGTEGAKSEAEVFLFTQLQQQIENNTKAIERLQGERDKWFEKATSLEREIERLRVFEMMVTSMKGRLDEKDLIIEARDTEIRQLTRGILDMKDRIHALELRLLQDEKRLCEHCERDKNATSVTS
jgi:predicted RNase H-like nuclease (RuvC/YqgF family)